jgi:threonine synthase
MTRYVSNKGGGPAVDFETCILNGRAPDGGLYVPTSLPNITHEQLQSWKDLNYTDLAFEILSLFIDESSVPASDLRRLIDGSFSAFYHAEKIPFYPLKSREGVIVQELFHGPTLSFKDVAMGFVVNLFDYFLKKRGEKMSIMVATSGDTGPAAAFASMGKKTLNTWTLYPEGFVTEEQERQMTTISASNVYAVRVKNCPDGSDDLDVLIADLFSDQAFKEEQHLSSVNSINWGRVMMQTVHYFYGYLQTVDRVGELLDFAVPSGAFGNLCAGGLAREMGLPVGKFIVSTNANICLQQIFRDGVYAKGQVINCVSSAIDISLPINFWRYLYFAIGQQAEKIKDWMEQAEATDRVAFDSAIHEQFSKGFLTASITNEQTLDTMHSVFESEGYLLDPHGAVAVAAADRLKNERTPGSKVLCLATAHPAKFPEAVKKALKVIDLPAEGTHPSLEEAKGYCQRVYECEYEHMHTAVPTTMRAAAVMKKGQTEETANSGFK